MPVYNNEGTVSAAVASVLTQTFSDFELIIVNDGSSDRSCHLAAVAAKGDPRVRIVDRPNGGVAAARNTGIGLARGEFIAPIDADDLWHSEKLERQLRTFEGSSSRVGLVYNWFRKIDEEGRVVAPPFTPLVEGYVLREHLRWNFIANGSTPLIKTEALSRWRYETALQAAGNQGCEDYLLQVQIASGFEFACAPAFLTGYRLSAESMSSNVLRMIRSHIQMYQILLNELPLTERPLLRRQLARHRAAHSIADLRRGKWRDAARGYASAMLDGPAEAVRESWARLVSDVRRKIGGSSIRMEHPLCGQPFFALSPDDGRPTETDPD